MPFSSLPEKTLEALKEYYKELKKLGEDEFGDSVDYVLEDPESCGGEQYHCYISGFMNGVFEVMNQDIYEFAKEIMHEELERE